MSEAEMKQPGGLHSMMGTRDNITPCERPVTACFPKHRGNANPSFVGQRTIRGTGGRGAVACAISVDIGAQQIKTGHN